MDKLRNMALAAELWFMKLRMRRDPGIDGILVTVGLCIIALLLCVVMKDSLAQFIKTIVASLTDVASGILTAPRN